MLNESLYKVVTDSLQDDINSGNVSYEYANIINDIAYKAYIEKEDLDENVRGVLERYITESTAVSDEDDYHYAYEYYDEENDSEAYIEACKALAAIDDVINYKYESVVNSLGYIIEAYGMGEITEVEMDALYESVENRPNGHEYFIEKENASNMKSKIKSWAANAKKKINDFKNKPGTKKSVAKNALKGAFSATLIAGAMVPGATWTKKDLSDTINWCLDDVSEDIENGNFSDAMKSVDGCVADLVKIVYKDVDTRKDNVVDKIEDGVGKAAAFIPGNAKRAMTDRKNIYGDRVESYTNAIADEEGQLKRLELSREGRLKSGDSDAQDIVKYQIEKKKLEIEQDKLQLDKYEKLLAYCNKALSGDQTTLIKMTQGFHDFYTEIGNKYDGKSQKITNRMEDCTTSINAIKAQMKK
jgi:hypothetical protein